jgi:pyruvate kinase
MNRTKMVCTVGPAVDSDEHIRALIRAGMSVARVNFSHGDHATHAASIERVRRIAQAENTIVAILGDLQGPKLRVGKIASGPVMTAPDQSITLTLREVEGDAHEVTLPHPELVHGVQPGQRLLIDDGALEFVVTAVTDTDLVCRVITGGPLSSNKGVSAPGANLSLSAITAKDRTDARFAVEQQLDFIALSFVRSRDDVCELRTLLNELGADIPIVTKIEKSEALDHIDGILACTNAIMIARGDLGVETPAESVPVVQKRLIRQCNARGIPVITATQMLQSMMTAPRPTRAEASDVANAIYDGTDAVMLSGETASGQYPIEAAQTMARIAAITEKDFPYENWLTNNVTAQLDSVAAIGRATVEIAEEIGARAIVTSTHTGNTAQLIAQFRPRTPIIATTPSEIIQRRLALMWGVQPMLAPEHQTTDEMLRTAAALVVKNGIAQHGDTILITAGIPITGNNPTNMLHVHVIGEEDGQ